EIGPGAGSGGSATVSALHDFEGDELRAVTRRGNTLYVAVNEFQRSGTVVPSSSGGPLAPRGTKMVTPPPSTSSTATPATSTRDRKGRGAVYRVDPDGRVEQLHALADGYFTALHVDGDGNVWAAAGSNGRVYLIRPDRTVITAFDLPERQVLTLAFDASAQKGGPSGLLGTGGTGRIGSPPGRYLQVRAGFGGARTVLRDLTAYYQPQNQRPRIAEITVGDDTAQKHVSAFARSGKPRSPVVKLRWRADNPDDD